MKAAESTSRKRDVVTASDVADYIKRRVRRGSLVPGQRVIEAEVIRDTGASRARVREALQRLSTEGIIVIEEFRGASVKRLTRAEVDQIYRTRQALEGLAALLFAERATQEEMDRLLRLQEEMNECETERDSDRFGVLNEEWHWLIIHGSRNALGTTFLERLRIPIFRMQFNMFYSKSVVFQANAGHREITAALLARDGETAERLMRQHILEGMTRISESDDEFFARDF